MSYFCEFNQPVDSDQLPTEFTYPYYYTPHTLAVQAVEQLQTKLQHELGLNSTHGDGQLFAVLVVKQASGQVGYLSAYAGQTKAHWEGFVPAIIEPAMSRHIKASYADKLQQLAQRIDAINRTGDIAQLEQALEQLKRQSDKTLTKLKQQHALRRTERKRQRQSIKQQSSEDEIQQQLALLSQQSISDKRAFTQAKAEWMQKCASLQQALSTQQNQLSELQQQYQLLTEQIEHQQFEQCPLHNAAGETKSITALFQDLDQTVPEGAGEGAFIKLLQFAYLNHLKPLTMAQFWWGKSPKAECRQHGQFYPASRRKSKPLLDYMLQGLALEPNLLESKANTSSPVKLIYQDDSMVVINKPPGLLSVPGHSIKDCVLSRMQALFPDATGPMIVHRLDMSTSGLMVIALNEQSYHHLQQQFITRQVNKRYVALLQGQLDKTEGEIDLPLRVDFDDRPRQLVCWQYGKPATTRWQIVQTQGEYTKVYFFPLTGRTHQLRMHAAHQAGLGLPIVGDELYGFTADRLYLHADILTLSHPQTGKTMSFESKPDF